MAKTLKFNAGGVGLVVYVIVVPFMFPVILPAGYMPATSFPDCLDTGLAIRR